MACRTGESLLPFAKPVKACSFDIMTQMLAGPCAHSLKGVAQKPLLTESIIYLRITAQAEQT